MYDEYENVVHLKNAPDVPTDPSFLTLKDLFTLMSKNKQTICVVTRKEFPDYVVFSQRDVIDWPKMITDLEISGKIKVSETKNVLASDPRKFFFIGESEDNSIDVDFLGTRMSQQESDRVVSEWELIA